MLIHYGSKQMTIFERVIEFTWFKNSDLFKNQSESMNLLLNLFIQEGSTTAACCLLFSLGVQKYTK